MHFVCPVIRVVIFPCTYFAPFLHLICTLSALFLHFYCTFSALFLHFYCTFFALLLHQLLVHVHLLHFVGGFTQLQSKHLALFLHFFCTFLKSALHFFCTFATMCIALVEGCALETLAMHSAFWGVCPCRGARARARLQGNRRHCGFCGRPQGSLGKRGESGTGGGGVGDESQVGREILGGLGPLVLVFLWLWQARPIPYEAVCVSAHVLFWDLSPEFYPGFFATVTRVRFKTLGVFVVHRLCAPVDCIHHE